MVPNLTPRARAVAERARHEALLWRTEPVYRAAIRGRLMRPWRVAQFGSFGVNSLVHRPTWLYGTRQIAIGDNVMILSGAWLSAERITWDRPEAAISIGEGSAIRAWVTLSASARITIGPNVVFGAGCSVVDSRHTWRNDLPNVLHNPVDAEPIEIGCGTWLGDRVTVLRGARVGTRCAIGAGSVVNGDIPDGSVAVGAPAKVIGRSEDL